MSEKKKKILKDDPRYKEYQDYMAKNGKSGYEKGTLYDKHFPSNGMVTATTFIEQEYPETANEFKRLQSEQYEMFCKKQMDYGPQNIAMGTQLKTESDTHLSLVGLIVRINDKIQRLLNLVVKNKREAQNEPTMDAFKDLSCYGIIAQIVKNGKWGK